MSNTKNKVIYVATDEELKDPSYYHRLWLETRNVPIPRRDWLDAIADAIRDFEGDILTITGQPYNIPCIDETFGDDPDIRWMGQFIAARGTGELPLVWTRKLERLRLIDLYFRIKHHEVARHFSM